MAAGALGDSRWRAGARQFGGAGHQRHWVRCGHFGGPLATAARSSGAFGGPKDTAQLEHDYKAPLRAALLNTLTYTNPNLKICCAAATCSAAQRRRPGARQRCCARLVDGFLLGPGASLAEPQPAMPPCAATIAAAQDDVAALSALLEQERAEADAADAVPGGSSLLEVDAAVGATPLHIAARRGHCAAVTWLLEHKASLTATDRDGATPLAMAVASEDIPTAAAVLAAVKSWDEGSSAVDAADTEGMTPLHDAAGLPHAALVKLLLGAQANPNAASANGVTPLVMCAAAERQMGSGAARCCSALLAAGADPAVAVGGQTPLVLALRARSWAAAGVLGAAAAAPDGGANNVDSVVLAGRTPLHNAAFIGDAEAVSYLLEKGAQPGLQDDAGRTALHAAASYGSAPTVMALLTAAAAGRKKLASVPDSAGGTALHDAALGGHVAVIQLLLTEENGGAELAGVEDKRGQTAEALARTMAASEDPAAAAALAALTGTAPAGVVTRQMGSGWAGGCYGTYSWKSGPSCRASCGRCACSSSSSNSTSTNIPEPSKPSKQSRSLLLPQLQLIRRPPQPRGRPRHRSPASSPSSPDGSPRSSAPSARPCDRSSAPGWPRSAGMTRPTAPPWE